MEEGGGGDRRWGGDTARLLDGDMDLLSDPLEALEVEGDRSWWRCLPKELDARGDMVGLCMDLVLLAFVMVFDFSNCFCAAGGSCLRILLKVLASQLLGLCGLRYLPLASVSPVLPEYPKCLSAYFLYNRDWIIQPLDDKTFELLCAMTTIYCLSSAIMMRMCLQ